MRERERELILFFLFLFLFFFGVVKILFYPKILYSSSYFTTRDREYLNII